MPRKNMAQSMSFNDDLFLISSHLFLMDSTPPKNRAANKLLHPKETRGERMLKDKMVITGKRLQREAPKRIKESPCLS